MSDADSQAEAVILEPTTVNSEPVTDTVTESTTEATEESKVDETVKVKPETTVTESSTTENDKAPEDTKTVDTSANSASYQPPVIQQPATTTAPVVPQITGIDSTLKFFVGGIHPNSDEADITRHFTKYGNIVSLQIMRDSITGRHRGFGFLTIRMQHNSMDVFKDEHVITGKKIDVRPMQPDAGTTLKRKIFVGGIGKTMSEQMIQEYFSKYGPVEKTTIMRQLDGTSRGFGFVVFAEESSAQKSLEATSHYIYGTKVDVRAAESRSRTAQKQAESMHYMSNDMYGHAYAGAYRPQVAKDYASYYRQQQNGYDSQHYASMTQQQLLSQQYAQQQMLHQQMLQQQQLAMAGNYGSYYGAAQQPGYGDVTAAAYGAYRGKSEMGPGGVAPGGMTGQPSGRAYRQEPY